MQEWARQSRVERVSLETDQAPSEAACHWTSLLCHSTSGLTNLVAQAAVHSGVVTVLDKGTVWIFTFLILPGRQS